MRLNVGCGDYPNKDKINVDIAYVPGVDVVCDAMYLPFKDDVADEVFLIHMVEHFRYLEVKKLLQEIKRVMKKDGFLIIEAPDLNKAINNFIENGNLSSLLKSLYGTQNKKYSLHQHYFCWTPEMMNYELKRVGLKPYYDGDGTSHNRPERDFRVQARK